MLTISSVSTGIQIAAWLHADNHILVDGDEYDLPKDWAEYKSDEDQAEWTERDREIEDDIDKNGDPTDPEWWWEAIHERLGDEKRIFSAIWEGTTALF